MRGEIRNICKHVHGVQPLVDMGHYLHIFLNFIMTFDIISSYLASIKVQTWCLSIMLSYSANLWSVECRLKLAQFATLAWTLSSKSLMYIVWTDFTACAIFEHSTSRTLMLWFLCCVTGRFYILIIYRTTSIIFMYEFIQPACMMVSNSVTAKCCI